MPFKNIILFLLFVLTININLFSQNEFESTNSDSITTVKNNYLIRNISDSIINYGKLFLNTPYRYGSTGTSSFDCSGFTSYVYRNFGVNLPRSSSEQAQRLPKVELKDLKNGDLVFFKGRSRNKRVGHVGIVVATKSDGDFDFIHASVHNGVIISNSKTPYYHKRFVKAGRVFADEFTIGEKLNFNNINRNEYVNATPTELTKKTIPAKYHSVKRGETLSSIAHKYNLSIASLKKKNNLRRDILKLKQKLIIQTEEVITIVQPILAENITQNNDSLTNSLKANYKNGEITQGNAIHIVKKGESLFSISKTYNIEASKLKVLNNLSSNKITVGQELFLIECNKTPNKNIAENIKVEIEIDKSETNFKSDASILKHKVSKGESLFSIAKLYNSKVDEIIEINQLLSNEIHDGQELLIKTLPIVDLKSGTNRNHSIKTHKVKSGETLSSIAAKYGCKINEIKNWNDKSNNKLIIGEKLIIKNLKS